MQFGKHFTIFKKEQAVFRKTLDYLLSVNLYKTASTPVFSQKLYCEEIGSYYAEKKIYLLRILQTWMVKTSLWNL